jgi:hypothetical protein
LIEEVAVVRFDGIVGILKWGEVATGHTEGVYGDTVVPAAETGQQALMEVLQCVRGCLRDKAE